MRCCFKLLSVLTCLMIAVSVSAEEKSKARKNKILTREDIMKLLETPCPEVHVETEATVPDVLTKFLADFKMKTGVDLGYLEDKQEFALEGIESLKDVVVQPIRIPEGAQDSHAALRSIFRFAVDDEPALTYSISNGMLLITTLAKAESDDNLFTKIYDLSEFLVVEEDVPKALRDRIVDDRGVKTLVSMLEGSTTPPGRWQNTHGEGGSIGIYGQYIVVRQTLIAHRQLDAFFDLLRNAIDDGGTPIVLRPNDPTPVDKAAVEETTAAKPNPNRQRKNALTSGGGFF